MDSEHDTHSSDLTQGAGDDSVAAPGGLPVPPPLPEGVYYPPVAGAQPSGDEGESIAWMADADSHLAPPVSAPSPLEGPLPVCDYTGEDDEPCEEPVVERRWSSVAVIMSAVMGALTGGLLVAVAAAWALGLIPGVRPVGSVESDQASTTKREVTIAPGGEKITLSEAVADKVVPSVVNVGIQQSQQNPFTGELQERTVGNGSGVIIRSSGYIITNNHVVEGADRITVTVGVEKMDAELVGTDPSSDLAVLKIEGTGYPALEVGSSADLKVGQYVMAVGSPFNLERTVTVGIVSALNRSQLMENGQDLTTYTNLIQTDAAINPGNSGGALVDAEGKLVGINALIQSATGQNAGIGFAIPVDYAIDIASQIISTGKATHAYMGVSTAAVNASVAEQFGLPVDSGAYVRFVQPGSPAEKAGVKTGDIIVKIDGVEIQAVEDVFSAIRQNKPGDTVDIEVVREDTRRDLQITLGSDADRR